MKLDRDLRYALAPLSVRAVYAMLFSARSSIAEVIALGHDPIAIASRVLGVDRDEAVHELERLRAAGLVGEGLTLLAGTRTRRGSAVSTGSNTEDSETVRAALAAHTGSRRALARELGCTEGALRAFASGRRSLGGDLLAALGAYLEVRTNACVPEVRTNECVPNAASTHVGTQQVSTQFGTQSLSPSDSLSPSLNPSLSSDSSKIEEKSNGGEKREGEGPGEGTQLAEVRTECVPTDDAGTQPAPLALDGAPSAPRRERRRKTAPAPAVDPVPPEGTVARRVYEAIVTDVELAPITRGPGDLAQRLAALCEGTTVDPAAEVILAGAWAARNRKWTDGAAGLLRWVKSSTDRARALPAPVVGTPRASSEPVRVDYQGRRVVGPAGLPSADAWAETDRDEEQEMLDRIAAQTQPRAGGVRRG